MFYLLECIILVTHDESFCVRSNDRCFPNHIQTHLLQTGLKYTDAVYWIPIKIELAPNGNESCKYLLRTLLPVQCGRVNPPWDVRSKKVEQQEQTIHMGSDGCVN